MMGVKGMTKATAGAAGRGTAAPDASQADMAVRYCHNIVTILSLTRIQPH
jgi:hypothetical protein